jgi:hypothetical protein
MKVAISYIRVSSEEQADSGLGLARPPDPAKLSSPRVLVSDADGA